EPAESKLTFADLKMLCSQVRSICIDCIFSTGNTIVFRTSNPFFIINSLSCIEYLKKKKSISAAAMGKIGTSSTINSSEFDFSPEVPSKSTSTMGQANLNTSIRDFAITMKMAATDCLCGIDQSISLSVIRDDFFHDQ